MLQDLMHAVLYPEQLTATLHVPVSNGSFTSDMSSHSCGETTHPVQAYSPLPHAVRAHCILPVTAEDGDLAGGLHEHTANALQVPDSHCTEVQAGRDGRGQTGELVWEG